MVFPHTLLFSFPFFPRFLFCPLEHELQGEPSFLTAMKHVLASAFKEALSKLKYE